MNLKPSDTFEDKAHIQEFSSSLQQVYGQKTNKEFTNELLNDNVQEECPIQKFEEPVGEEVKELINGNQEQVSENAEEDHKVVTNQK